MLKDKTHNSHLFLGCKDHQSVIGLNLVVLRLTIMSFSVYCQGFSSYKASL